MSTDGSYRTSPVPRLNVYNQCANARGADLLDDCRTWQEIGSSHVAVRTVSRDNHALPGAGDHVKMLGKGWRVVHGG